MVREGYKETELGEIPVDWEILELRLIVKNTEQITPERTPNKIFKYIDVSSISRNLLKIKSYSEFIGKFAPSRARKQIKANDIIFSTIRPYLKQVSLIDGKYNGELCSTAFCVIRCDKEILSPSFCFFYMTDDNFIKGVSKYESGSNYPAVLDKDIKNQLIILPPLPEQHRIAAVLSTIDETIEKTERLIGKLKMEKAGLMADLLTKGIDEEGRVRSEETHEFYDSEIGRVPVGWEVKRIIDSSNCGKETVQTGPFGAQLHSYDYVSIGTPLILIKNLINGKIDTTDIPKITEEKVKELGRYKVKKGDLIFSRVGAVGRNALIVDKQEGWIISGQMLRIRLKNENIDNSFLKNFVDSKEFDQILANEILGTTRQSINTTILENLKIKVPPLPEQHRIASVLTAADNRIEKEEIYRDKLLTMKKGLMPDLLTGKVRVPEGVI